MDTSLLTLLGFCWALAAILYYLFVVRREVDLGGLGKSGLIILMFVITPVLVIALWNQSEAEVRLSRVGFNAHPGFVSSVGIATGAGSDPVWVFSVETDENLILNYYKKRENHGPWQLVSESENSLLFQKEAEIMTIHVSDKRVVFSLIHKQ